jgi:hypothetical protein
VNTSGSTQANLTPFELALDLIDGEDRVFGHKPFKNLLPE